MESAHRLCHTDEMFEVILESLVRLFSAPGFSALIAAAAAILGSLLTIRADRKRLQAQANASLAAETITDLRALLAKLAELELLVQGWIEQGLLVKERPSAPADRMISLRVDVGVLRDARVRTALEDGLYAFENMGVAADWNTVKTHPVVAQGQIIDAVMEISKAAARGDDLPEKSLRLVQRYKGLADKALAEFEHFWTVQHGKG